MPRKDKTGPTGMGPMTGRKTGYCNNSTTAGYENQSGCSGMGRRSRQQQGQGAKMGCGNGPRSHRGCSKQAQGQRFKFANGTFVAGDTSANDDKTSLKTEIKALQSQLEAILNRIDNLEN